MCNAIVCVHNNITKVCKDFVEIYWKSTWDLLRLRPRIGWNLGLNGPTALSHFLETRKPWGPFSGEGLDKDFQIETKCLLKSSKICIYHSIHFTNSIAAKTSPACFSLNIPITGKYTWSWHLHKDTRVRVRALTRTRVRCCLRAEWRWLLTGVHWIHTSPWWILRCSRRFNCKGSWPSGARRYQGSSAVSHLLLRMVKGKLMGEVHTHTHTRRSNKFIYHMSFCCLSNIDASWLPCPNIFFPFISFFSNERNASSYRQGEVFISSSLPQTHKGS